MHVHAEQCFLAGVTGLTKSNGEQDAEAIAWACLPAQEDSDVDWIQGVG